MYGREDPWWYPRAVDRWDPRIDAAHPALAPLSAAMAAFRGHEDFPPLAAWNAGLGDGLCAGSGQPIRFVQQPRKRRRGERFCFDDLYDERIWTRGEVPSRPRTWHDFFNMLVWRSFPRLKAAINRRQRAALQVHVDPDARRLPSARTKEMDALAMLDEGGVVMLLREGAPSLDAALEEGEPAPIADAVARGDARVLLIGHAVHERLARHGALGVRALVLELEVPRCDLPFDEVDARAAARLDDALPVRARPDAKGLLLEPSLFQPPPASGGGPP